MVVLCCLGKEQDTVSCRNLEDRRRRLSGNGTESPCSDGHRARLLAVGSRRIFPQVTIVGISGARIGSAGAKCGWGSPIALRPTLQWRDARCSLIGASAAAVPVSPPPPPPPPPQPPGERHLGPTNLLSAYTQHASGSEPNLPSGPYVPSLPPRTRTHVRWERLIPPVPAGRR